MRARDASAVLTTGIRIGFVLLLWMPLIVTPSTIYPFVVGKALYARSVIEVVAGLWVLLLLVDTRCRPPRSWVLLAFLAYLAVALLSGLWGVDATHSVWSDFKRMLGAWDLAHWFLVALVAASVLRTPESWRTLLNWNLAVALVLSLLALSQAFGFSPLWYLTSKCRIDVTLGNPSYLAAILVVTILLAVGFLVRSTLPRDDSGGQAGEPAAIPSGRRRRRHRQARRGQDTAGRRDLGLLWARAFWAATAVLGLWVLFMTGTRGALVGLVGGVVMPIAALVGGDRRVRRPLALGAGGLLLAVGLLAGLGQTVGLPVAPGCRDQVASIRLVQAVAPAVVEAEDREAKVEEMGVAESVLGSRFLVAGIGLRGFLDRPLLGWGQENFARVFDRFAEASIYRYGHEAFDQAHNKVIEELATKGALGTLAYLALWAALVWAIVRRRRPLREEALAYAVLGALAGYFVQNLFLFDTPAMLLQWALLVGWVAGQERAPEATAPEPRSTRRGRPLPTASPPVLGSPWGQVLAGTAAVALVIASLVTFNYRPYSAAQMALQAKIGKAPVAARIETAERGYGTFPPLATLARQEFLGQLATQWNEFSPEEKALVVRYAEGEATLAWQEQPRHARLLAAAYAIPQATVSSPEALERLEPVLQRLQELAPERLYTHQYLAVQEVLKGNYGAALRIVEEYTARAPGTASSFERIVQDAQAGLARSGAAR